jgi:hypothetical protein
MTNADHQAGHDQLEPRARLVIFGSDGAEVLITPVQAPNANASAERWIRTVRAECLDWLLTTGRGHLEQVLRSYVEHDNGHRPHRALGLESPDAPTGPVVIGDNQRRVLHATGSTACSTSTTDKLHEPVSAPYGLGEGAPPARCGPCAASAGGP